MSRSELEQAINELDGLEIPCWHGSVDCKYSPMTEGDKRMIVSQQAGAEIQVKSHDGGIPDSEDKKYWVFVECPDCGYQMAHDKIIAKLDREAKNPGGR